MFKRDFGVGATLAVILVILLAINLAAGVALRSVKYDLTEYKLYSLSPATRSLLSKLDDSVKIKLFYSRRAASGLPQIKPYADRTIVLLKQFAAGSHGKLTLEIVDPEPDSPTEEEAMKYGMTALPAKGDENVYFGLVATGETTQGKVTPFLHPEREGFLEYDVAQLISSVSHPEKKTIGIMSPLDVMGGFGNDPMARFQGRPAADPWAVVSQLRQSYSVKDVSATVGEIDSSIDVLLVIHPKKLAEQTEYAIDQFVVKGGRAIILVDGTCEYELEHSRSPNMQNRFQESFDSTLPRLFKAWGIDMPAGKVIADKDLGLNVRFGGQQAQYPIWMMVPATNCNQDEIISANMEQLIFKSAAPLKKSADSKYEVTPLIESNPTAMEMDSFLLKLGPNPDQMNKDYKPGNQRLGIAVKLGGMFETAFPEGKPKSVLPEEPGKKPEEKKPDEDPKTNHVAQGDSPTTVLIFSDVDFITEGTGFTVVPFFGGQKIISTRMGNFNLDNLNLITNAIEVMTGSNEMIALRTRGKSSRPFTRVEEMDHEAKKRFEQELKTYQTKVEEVTRQIEEIERGKKPEGGQRAILSPDQVSKLDGLNKERVDARRKVREINRNLRKEIEGLGLELRLLNIALMPILVILAGFVPLAWRSYRMRSARA